MVRAVRPLAARIGLALLFSTMGASVVYCSAQEEGALFADAASGPCSSTPSGRCGAPCGDDLACPEGQHCAADRCTADCTATNRGSCADARCTDRGRCGVAPSDASSFADAGTRTEEDAATCASIDVEVSKVVPTVVLLVDQSSSMESTFDGVQTPAPFVGSRWTLLRDALMSADGGIVKKYEGDVEFGLALYSANDGNEKPPAVATCPIMKVVPFARTNHAGIDAVYARAVPIDDTPTGEAVRAAAGLDTTGRPVDGGLASLPTGRPKVIVLATDGEPATCANLSATGTPQAQQLVVDSVKAAYRAGIQTYVISVGSNVSETHQQAVANAGLGYFDGGSDASADARAPLIRTNNRADLGAALDAIVLGVRSCTFKLQGSVVAGTESRGDVRINGLPAAYNDADGWRLVSASEIELTGAACSVVKTTDARVSVRFPCEGFVPR